MLYLPIYLSFWVLFFSWYRSRFLSDTIWFLLEIFLVVQICWQGIISASICLIKYLFHFCMVFYLSVEFQVDSFFFHYFGGSVHCLLACTVSNDKSIVFLIFVPQSSVSSVGSDYFQPCGPWPARLPWLWESPGKNTGVGCH